MKYAHGTIAHTRVLLNNPLELISPHSFLSSSLKSGSVEPVVVGSTEVQKKPKVFTDKYSQLGEI